MEQFPFIKQIRVCPRSDVRFLSVQRFTMHIFSSHRISGQTADYFHSQSGH